MNGTLNKEEPLWQGRPSQWVNARTYLFCLLTCWLIIPACVAAVRWLRTRTTRYELTSQRLLVSTGILSRQTDALELYRVRDLRIVQPLLLRMLSLGDVILDTSDITTPFVALQGVPDARILADVIRTHVEQCRLAKRVREIDID
jgi:uncharacterized membrane protein YdbT with pleckstrin-like domain